MAPLTWRNVATPNMGDPVDALRLGGTMLDRGFTNLTESLSRFNTWRDDQNARLVGDAALRIQDPNQLREALANGTLLSGMPGGSLTPAAMEALQGRAGTLLAQDQARENLRHSTVHNPTIEATAVHTLDRARIDAPLRTAALGLENTRTGQAIRAEDFAHEGRVYREPGLRTEFDRRIELGGATHPNQMDEQRRIGQARIDTDAANAAISQSNRIVNGDDARVFLDEQRARVTNGEISPAAFQAIERNIMGRFQSTFAPVADGASGTAVPGAGTQAVAASVPVAPAVSGTGSATPAVAALAAGTVGANPSRDPRLHLPSPGGTHGTQAGSSYDVTYRNRPTAQPITTMPIGDVLNLQESFIQREGNSPMGAFQINRDTLRDFAPRVLGENWRSMAFTPEVQDRLGRAIFEARRGGDLTQTWSALRNVPGADRAGAFANMSWEQVRGEISRREARTTADGGAASSLPVGERATQALRHAGDITHQQDRLAGQNRGGSLVPGLQAASNSTDSAATVVQQLRQAFPNEDEGRLSAELNRLMRGTGPNGTRLTPAEAGLIMIQNTTSRTGRGATTAGNAPDGRSWWGRNIFEALGGERDARIPEIATFDSAANDALVQRYAAGELAQDERRSRDIQGNQTALANARTAVENARNQVAALRARSREDPTNERIPVAIQRAEARLLTATEALESVNDRLRGVEARRDTPPGRRRNNDGAAGATGAARDALAAAATEGGGPRGPTRGSRIAELGGGPGGTARAAPVVRAGGPGGTARPGTIPRGNVIDENDPMAGMFNPVARAGRQADETGVNQARLALALGSAVLGPLGVARQGAVEAALAGRALAAGGRLAPSATPVDAMLARTLAAGGRAVPGAPLSQAAEMAATVSRRQGAEVLESIFTATRGGMSMPEAIAAVSRASGVRPEVVTRIVQSAGRTVAGAP